MNLSETCSTPPSRRHLQKMDKFSSSIKAHKVSISNNASELSDVEKRISTETENCKV